MPVIGNKDHIFPCNNIRDCIRVFFQKVEFKDLFDELGNPFLPYGPEKYLLLFRFRTRGASRAAYQRSKVNQVIAFAAIVSANDQVGFDREYKPRSSTQSSEFNYRSKRKRVFT